MTPPLLTVERNKKLAFSSLLFPEKGKRSIQEKLCDTLASSNDSSFLSDLLPYDPSTKNGANLRDSLGEYLLLLTAAERAMLALQDGDLKWFDPVVGENACQIRALKAALLFSNRSLDTENLLTDLLHTKKRVFAILANVKQLTSRGITLDELLEEGHLNINLTPSQIFFVETYLLTIVRTVKPLKGNNPIFINEATDAKKIKRLSSVGTMFAMRLVNLLRERVAEASVSFIQELAEKLPKGDSKKRMLSNRFSIFHKKIRSLHCLPCYWVTRLVLQSALTECVPIVIVAAQRAKDKGYAVVEKSVLFFEATPSGYKQVPASKLDGDSAVIVLKGTTCDVSTNLADRADWEAKLAKLGPIELFSAHSAAHRQYPDPTKEHLIDSVYDPEYEYYKKKADEWGCTLENPSGFFIYHAYCDKLSNIEVPQLVSC